MKVIHIESGLGNQMLSYGELLVMQKLNPLDSCYIETIIYDIPECSEVICQWNGYELGRIFGIAAPNIRVMFEEEQWERVLQRVRRSQFWKDWNYPQAIVGALREEGLDLVNLRGQVNYREKASLIRELSANRAGYYLKRICRPLYQEKYIQRNSKKDKIFLQTQEDVFNGQWLGLKNKDSGIEFVDREIRETFRFPNLEGDRNKETAKVILANQSVAIHARRGDMLSSNGFCYRYGYFKRAVRFIKSQVRDPLFLFFCDQGSTQWCRENESIFGLNSAKDRIMFVDWNTGQESYRDMQLMAMCRHNIITNSSFGWWGAWLNENPEKITCSPSVFMNTTHHF